MRSTRTRGIRPIALLAGVILIGSSCGNGDDAESNSSTTERPPTSKDASIPATTDAVTTTTASTPDTTIAGDDTSTTTATTEVEVGSDTDALFAPIPNGEFEADESDLFLLRRDGDLVLLPGVLAGRTGEPVLVADYPDPYGAVTEGSGPNVIDQVAGIVAGSVVFGDCCEPISGNIIVATAPTVADPILGGYSPTLSPTGDLLGAANDYLISQTSTDASGAGRSRQLNQGPTDPYLNVADLTWSSNATTAADDDHIVLLAWTDAGWWLHDVDRSTLDPTPAVDLGVAPVSQDPDTDIHFAGHGPDDEIVVSVNDGTATRLRYFAPSTLGELSQMERALPASATSVRLASDGIGLLWVDGANLYHLPAGGSVADRVDDGVLAAWFTRIVER